MNKLKKSKLFTLPIRKKFSNGASEAGKAIALIFSVLAMVFLIGVIAQAWNEPTCDPSVVDPSTCNVSPPINEGSGFQEKTGNLALPNLYLNATGAEGNIYEVDWIVGNNNLYLKGNSDGNAPVYVYGSELGFYYGGAEKWKIDSAGILQAGSVPWARLSNFPSDCASGKYVYGIDGTTNAFKCSVPEAGSGTGYWGLTGWNLYPNEIGYNVGIGTKDAGSYKLKVYGSDYGIYGRGAQAGIVGVSDSKTGVYGLTNGTGTQSAIYGQNTSTGPGVYGYSTNGIGVRGFSQNGWAGYFQGDAYVYGDVGIGITDPTVKLDVAGYVKGRDGLCIGNVCKNAWPEAGAGYWSLAGSTLYPDTNYNIAIGTADPEGYRLNVKGGQYGIKSLGTSYGVYAIATLSDGIAIYGDGPGGGVYGRSDTKYGVLGMNNSRTTPAVYGYNAYSLNMEGGAGVKGYSNYGFGVMGSTYKGYVGVYGAAHNAEAFGWQPMWGFFTPDKIYAGLKISIGEIEPDADADLYVGDGTGRDLYAPPGWISAGDGYANLVIESKTEGKFPLIKMKNTLGNWQIWASDDDLVFRRGGGTGILGTRMLLDAETGFVGIGTADPSYELDVAGRIQASGDVCTNLGGGKCLSTVGAGGGGYWTQSGSNLYPNNTGWNVGIKTTNPSPFAALDVNGRVQAQELRIDANGAKWTIKIDSSRRFVIEDILDLPRLVIEEASGKVGIATNPTEQLDVAGYVKGRSGLCIGNDCRNKWPTEANIRIQSGVAIGASYACQAGGYSTNYVSFPSAFSSVPSVIITAKGTTPAGAIPVASLKDVSATGFNFYWSTNDYGRNCAVGEIYWIAIGQ